MLILYSVDFFTSWKTHTLNFIVWAAKGVFDKMQKMLACQTKCHHEDSIRSNVSPTFYQFHQCTVMNACDNRKCWINERRKRKKIFRIKMRNNLQHCIEQRLGGNGENLQKKKRKALVRNWTKNGFPRKLNSVIAFHICLNFARCFYIYHDFFKRPFHRHCDAQLWYCHNFPNFLWVY